MKKADTQPSGADQQAVIDELNHRMRNVLTIVQSLVNQSERTSASVEEMAADLRDRIAAFSRSHDQLSRTGFEAAPLRDLVAVKLEPFALGERLVIDGPDVNLTAPAFTSASMALHELATNAVKYGALSEPAGRLHVTWRHADSEVLEIRWQESGGPAVKQPEHSGHGSRLLDKVIVEGLGGQVCIDYAASGLSVTMTIPASCVVIPETRETCAQGGDDPARQDARIELPADFSVLVVEDNAVIALDIAEIVRQFGAGHVENAATLDEAHALLDNMHPDFVLLDVNLGEESSVGFAGELAAAGKRFAFMTGSDQAPSLPGELGQRPLLRKPYSDASIREVLSRMSAGR